MNTAGVSSRTRSISSNTSSQPRKKASDLNVAIDSSRRSLSTPRSMGLMGERTVKRLRLSKALTLPETTTIYEGCRRLIARRVDALLLTDSNGLLCGILTARDIATKVIACRLNLEETPASKVMTRNPTFVLSDTLAVEALQKMVQGSFRHLPVVENGEVIALLDIAKCLYDAISRMERAAEKGKAIAAAVEGVEKHWGTSISGSNTFMETLRERVLRPSLSTIIPDNSKIVTLTTKETVLTAAKKMLESQVSAAIVTVDSKPKGILTSKDMLMRMVAQNLPPATTLVEKVMTQNPECARLDTPIIDALHIMHDGNFLHLPVINKDGIAVALLNVLQITQSAVSTVGGNDGMGSNELGSNLMQKFWDSALQLSQGDEEDDAISNNSMKLAEASDAVAQLQYSPGQTNKFAFKVQDKKGIMYRFNCETGSLRDLVAAILQRMGNEISCNSMPQIFYEDEDHDKVVLASDNDLAAAVDHARLAGWKGLRLHLDYSGWGRSSVAVESKGGGDYSTIGLACVTGAMLIVGLGVVTYYRRCRN
ncbi:CBS domain-containing protein CBSCBSPB5-like [Impatiens glandulifera]|uniref:CBS domain-containing protein CBSCBSPB5-like n=1 Tax=Impatiens glandulifera TaxID=253017 RepID=UPI001FB0D892|nr:CBS domain-containing protein CBSCBSPB5-like [Impatiens glandulifera]XP_047338735.1 CBS domain-containing protein CBSCBSPB5-like [Impatiens glandulifera]XP_047338736.1 CBS domain-containing protein CBSCBSPB5-like [Impatiens glandulifera]